jgi:hypothetical protein
MKKIDLNKFQYLLLLTFQIDTPNFIVSKKIYSPVYSFNNKETEFFIIPN